MKLMNKDGTYWDIFIGKYGIIRHRGSKFWAPFGYIIDYCNESHKKFRFYKY
jgi:hypothetical protein